MTFVQKPSPLSYLSRFLLGVAVAAVVVAIIHPGPDPWSPWVFWPSAAGSVFTSRFFRRLFRRDQR